jgi:hypothetical protein
MRDWCAKQSMGPRKRKNGCCRLRSQSFGGCGRRKCSIDHPGLDRSGAVHTNTIKGFCSIIKRGVVGTFHKVSKKHMPLYVAEFQFCYNSRFNADIFGATISAC